MDAFKYLSQPSEEFKKSFTLPLCNVQTKTTGAVRMVTATSTTMTTIPSSSISSKSLISDCCVPGCSSSKWNRDRYKIRFHHFPPARIVEKVAGVDQSMRSIWIRVLFPGGINGSSDLPWSIMSVCSKHFKQSDYCKVGNGPTELLAQAYPTLNLGHNYPIKDLLATVASNSNEETDRTNLSPRIDFQPALRSIKHEEDACGIITPGFHEVSDNASRGEPEVPILIDAGTPVILEGGDGKTFPGSNEPQMNSASQSLVDHESPNDESTHSDDIDLDKYSLTDAFKKSIELMEQVVRGTTATASTSSETSEEPSTTPVSKELSGSQSIVGVKVQGKLNMIKRPFIMRSTIEVAKFSNSTKRARTRKTDKACRARCKNNEEIEAPKMTKLQMKQAVETACVDHNYCCNGFAKSFRRLMPKPEVGKLIEEKTEEVVESSPTVTSNVIAKKDLIHRAKDKICEIREKGNSSRFVSNLSTTVKEYHDFYLNQVRKAVKYKYRRGTASNTSKLNDVIPCPHCLHGASTVNEFRCHLLKHRQEPLKLLKCSLCNYSTAFFSLLLSHDENFHYNIEREGKTVKGLNHEEFQGLLDLVARSNGGVPTDFHIFPVNTPAPRTEVERFWPIVTKEFNRMYPPLGSNDQYRSELFLKREFYALKQLAKEKMVGKGENLTFDKEITALRDFIANCAWSNRPIFDGTDYSKLASPGFLPSNSTTQSEPSVSTESSVEIVSNTESVCREIKTEPGVEKQGTSTPQSTPSSSSGVPKKVHFTLGQENQLVQALPGRKEVYIVDINKITRKKGSRKLPSPSDGLAALVKRQKITPSVGSKLATTETRVLLEANKAFTTVSQSSSPAVTPAAGTTSYPCTLCSSGFNLLKNLQRHMDWHKEKAERAVTQSVTRALAHLNPATANSFNCDCCEFSAGSTEELEEHMTSHFRVTEDEPAKVEEEQVTTSQVTETPEEDDEECKSEEDDSETDHDEVITLSESISQTSKVEEGGKESGVSDDNVSESSDESDLDLESDILDYSDDVNSDPDFDALELFRVDRSKIKNSKEFKILKKELEEERYWDMMAKKSFEKQQRNQLGSIGENKSSSTSKGNRKKPQQRSLKKVTDKLLVKKIAKKSAQKETQATLQLVEKTTPEKTKPEPAQPLPDLETPQKSASPPAAEISPKVDICLKSKIIEQLSKVSSAVEKRKMNLGAKSLLPAFVDETTALLAVAAVVNHSEMITCDKCPFSGNAEQLRIHQTWQHSSLTTESETEVSKHLKKRKKRKKHDSLHYVSYKKKKKSKSHQSAELELAPSELSQSLLEVTPPVSPFSGIKTTSDKESMKNHMAEQRHLEPLNVVRKRIKLVK